MVAKVDSTIPVQDWDQLEHYIWLAVPVYRTWTSLVADEHAGADLVLKLVLSLVFVLVQDSILAVVPGGIRDLVQALVLIQGCLLKSHDSLVLPALPQIWFHPQHILSQNKSLNQITAMGSEKRNEAPGSMGTWILSRRSTMSIPGPTPVFSPTSFNVSLMDNTKRWWLLSVLSSLGKWTAIESCTFRLVNSYIKSVTQVVRECKRWRFVKCVSVEKFCHTHFPFTFQKQFFGKIHFKMLGSVIVHPFASCMTR